MISKSDFYEISGFQISIWKPNIFQNPVYVALGFPNPIYIYFFIFLHINFFCFVDFDFI